MEKIIIKSQYDRNNIYCNFYNADNPKAIIQIIHGMKEHQLRYEDFALFLNKFGYSVITSDLRGHGHNAELLGFMDGKKPWEALVLDQVSICEYLKNHYPDTKVYLFAHSMGTIIARNLLQKYDDNYEKVCLSGVPGYQAACNFGIVLAKIIGGIKSNSYACRLFENLTLAPFAKSVKNAKTSSDWISKNPKNVERYLADPYCNIPFTVSAYKALYHLVKGMNKVNKYQVKEPNLPILMLVGEDDPCPLGEKGLKHSLNTLKKAGYNNLDYKRYPNMRHEILNEENNQLVYEDILNFFQKDKVLRK